MRDYRKKSISFIKQEFNKEGYELLSEDYVNAHGKLDYICPNGHNHNISWTNFQQGQRCFYCVCKRNSDNLRMSIEYIRNEFEKDGYKLLTIRYINSRQKLKYICPKGHIRTIKWDHWKVGSRCSECRNVKFSLKYQGDGNPFWKGGTSCDPYCYMWSFKEFKDFIKRRDGNRCLNPTCNGKYKNIVLHHIDYNKKNCNIDNLITLCNSCNSMANKDRTWHIYWYRAILFKRYGYFYKGGL